VTASELKHEVETRGGDSHFFDRRTMRFFGDTMRNYGVRGPLEIETHTGRRVRAYELYRRRAVKHGLRRSAWFDASTFERVFADVKED